jgi:tellurium resistance protein TerD
MAISLVKGQKIDLTKTNPSLTKIKVGLGWNTNKYDGGKEFDLDSCVGLLDENGKCVKDENFVYFSNLEADGVTHKGDNLTGIGDGDDEVIEVELSKINGDVKTLDFNVVIYEADARNQNFGQISDAFVRIVNAETDEELIRYDLGEDYSTETTLNIAKLYRHGSEWKFNAIGAGTNGGFNSILTSIGLK